jgi:hypothetical protein
LPPAGACWPMWARGLLAARVAIAVFGLRCGYFGGCAAGAQGGILRTAEIPQVACGTIRSGVIVPPRAGKVNQ